MLRIVDRQMQGVDLRASVAVGVPVEEVSALGNGGVGAVSPVPGVATARRFRGVQMLRIVDRQVEGVDLRASVAVSMPVEKVSALSDGGVGAVGPVPGVATARRF